MEEVSGVELQSMLCRWEVEVDTRRAVLEGRPDGVRAPSLTGVVLEINARAGCGGLERGALRRS